LKVIVFDDVLCRRAPEYEVPDLELQFYAHADDAVAVVAHERPDVVLMDYSMQARASGEDAIRALRAAFPRGAGGLGPSGAAGGAERSDIVIVAISADERSNERMLAAGADDALPKTHVKGYLSRLARLK
jgi:CheY-like chemotaxis protein